METIGERLRREREAHSATIEQISAATGILLTYLEALERNDFSSLPGRAFGKLYIRAYGETLGFDPQRLIDEYDREQEQPVAPKLPAPDPVLPPRRVEAVIERWRRTARAERARPAQPAESVEIETGGLVEAPPRDSPIDESEAMGTAAVDLTQAPPDAPDDMRREPADSAPLAVVTSVPLPDARASAPIRASRPVVMAALAMGLCAGAVWALLALLQTGAEPDEAPPVASVRRAPSPDPPRVAPVRESVVPKPVAPPASRSTPRAALELPESSDLVISDHGVGPRIAGHELVDRVGRFAQWDVARFWTRVIGGEPGDVIRHVWLREGRVVQTIELELGGDDWRTHSRKTLGQPGEWAVEARDLDGRVLARTTFTCSAPRR